MIFLSLIILIWLDLVLFFLLFCFVLHIYSLIVSLFALFFTNTLLSPEIIYISVWVLHMSGLLVISSDELFTCPLTTLVQLASTLGIVFGLLNEASTNMLVSS